MIDPLGRLGGWLYQQPYLLLSITYFTWGVNLVVGRYVVGHIPPMALTWLRWGLAFLMVLPFAWPHLKHDWPAIRSRPVYMTVLGVVGTTGFNALAYWALQYTQSINAMLIQATSPLMVALVGFVIFRDRLTTMQTLGIVTSFLGVVSILCRGDIAVLRAVDFNRGDVWFVVAMTLFAFYAVFLRQRPKMHPSSFLAFTMGCGTLWLTPLVVLEMSSGAVTTFDLETILVLIYIAVFPSVVAYVCYNRGVELVGSNRASMLYPLIVVFGSSVAIPLLGETPQLFHAIGYVLIFAGVIVATRAPKTA
jgi:drug/metabolite transporter (DMT)-like permease